MRYWSDQTRKFYDSEKACVEAEEEHEKAMAAQKAQKEADTAARKARAKRVEEAYKEMVEAQKTYKELLRAFCEDYGSYHMTFTSGDDTFTEIFDRIFRFF